jgi:hypothetical protein
MESMSLLANVTGICKLHFLQAFRVRKGEYNIPLRLEAKSSALTLLDLI